MNTDLFRVQVPVLLPGPTACYILGIGQPWEVDFISPILQMLKIELEPVSLPSRWVAEPRPNAILYT